MWLAAVLAPTDLVPLKLYPEFLLAMTIAIYEQRSLNIMVGVGAERETRYSVLHTHNFQLRTSYTYLFACTHLCRNRTKGKTLVVLFCFVLWCCCCVVGESEFFWGLVVKSFWGDTCFFLVLVLLLMLLLLLLLL